MRGREHVPVTTTVRSAIGRCCQDVGIQGTGGGCRDTGNQKRGYLCRVRERRERDRTIRRIRKCVRTASELSIFVLAYKVTSPTLRRATV